MPCTHRHAHRTCATGAPAPLRCAVLRAMCRVYVRAFVRVACARRYRETLLSLTVAGARRKYTMGIVRSVRQMHVHALQSEVRG